MTKPFELPEVPGVLSRAAVKQTIDAMVSSTSGADEAAAAHDRVLAAFVVERFGRSA